MRRDLAIALGYCCDAGEEEGGSLGPLRVYVENVEVEGGCGDGGKPMSGTTLLNGRRSVRLEMSGVGGRGFL